MSWRTLAAATIVLAFLAGCAEEIPSGELVELGHTPPFQGTASLLYQPATGANPAGGIPVVGGDLQCVQPDPDPTGQAPPCRPAYTNVQVNVTAPLAGSGTYAAYLTNGTHSVHVADLAESEVDGSTARYTGGKNFTEDLSGSAFLALELRLDDLLVAEAPAQSGPQTFTLAVARPQVTGLAYSGDSLTGTVAGLSANATYRGHLYLPDADGNAQAQSAESFAITGDGTFGHTSSRQIHEFVEFHIHVGDSKVNVYKASIPRAEA